VNIRLRLWMGKRSGEASTNRLDDQAFDEIVERARSAARVSPEDETGELDDPGLAEPAPYSQVLSFDEETSVYPAEKRALAVQQVPAGIGDLQTSAHSLVRLRSLANSRGLCWQRPRRFPDQS
jgi:predicted Zn-dependent protease